MPQLVTIKRYRDLSEAIVARSLLQSSGIEAYLCDENFVRLEWQISNFIGGIRLQVAPVHEEDAIAILTAPPPEVIDFESDQAYTQPHCPMCNSTDVSFEGSSRKAALASLYLVSLPLPLGRETWACSRCNSRWQDDAQ